ncbi:glucan endo-1,3-beta-glucosidase-like [Populus trichocarpa]|uniref:glucan endo-1,3-beta-glucosidase-like n=1 Tax=Populus trichocarpa TaxID=3694 RepID=UPI002279B2BE|nr:glucan endo-1,3-beta-glucosidase-like [Populus trichocarpa]
MLHAVCTIHRRVLWGKPNAYNLPAENEVVSPYEAYGICRKNLFDALMDALYSALEKAGGSYLKIAVSESGWASAGGTVETAESADTSYRNLIDHVKGLQGGLDRLWKFLNV